MASRFWVGGTGTWDSTTTTHWATGTGGGGGASAPVAGDTITFDGASGGGTVTPDTSINSIAFASLTAGAFTGTLAFNTNNPTMVFTGIVSFSGSGARVINMGIGSWSMTGYDCATTTTLTPTFSNAAIIFTGASANRLFGGGGQTYGAWTINDNATKGFLNVTGGNTFASITCGSGSTLGFPQGTTTTVTGALVITGTSSAPSGIMSNAPSTNVTTISVGSASTMDWGAVLRVTKSGAGSITATNSLDLGGNTSVTITAPSGGGSSGGQRVISG